jgi:predicted nucleotidyltransferase
MRIPDLENLKKVFCRYPEIRAVYMFGSRASGRVHRESDLVVRQYLDFLPFLEVQRKALKERPLNDKA